MPPGAGSEEFLALVEHVVVPIGRAYAPDLIVISAGYDAHRDDPLASCMVETAAYGEMTAAMRALGDELGAPVLVCLEGGYSPPALAESVVATLGALANGGVAAGRVAGGGRAAPLPPARALGPASRSGDQAVLDVVRKFRGKPGDLVEIVDRVEAAALVAVADHPLRLGHRHPEIAQGVEVGVAEADHVLRRR